MIRQTNRYIIAPFCTILHRKQAFQIHFGTLFVNKNRLTRLANTNYQTPVALPGQEGFEMAWACKRLVRGQAAVSSFKKSPKPHLKKLTKLTPGPTFGTSLSGGSRRRVLKEANRETLLAI